VCTQLKVYTYIGTCAFESSAVVRPKQSLTKTKFNQNNDQIKVRPKQRSTKSKFARKLNGKLGKHDTLKFLASRTMYVCTYVHVRTEWKLVRQLLALKERKKKNQIRFGHNIMPSLETRQILTHIKAPQKWHLYLHMYCVLRNIYLHITLAGTMSVSLATFLLKMIPLTTFPLNIG
jgi:hypothetical protein